MVHVSNVGLRVAVLMLILGVQTGCSSSQVEATDVTPEVMAETAPEAGTNDVPQAPPEGMAPGALDASSDPSPIADATTPAEEAPLAPPEGGSALAAAPDESPAEAPSASANEAPSASSSGVAGEMTRYKVKSGDTLMKIAFEKYGDLYRWREILNANSTILSSGNDLKTGTVLNIEGAMMIAVEHNGEIYLIKKGDTLGLISGEVYGTPKKWKRLWENNRDLIKNPNKIYAGFNLYYVPESKLTEGAETDRLPSSKE